jgi:hypothetical protein
MIQDMCIFFADELSHMASGKLQCCILAERFVNDMSKESSSGLQNFLCCAEFFDAMQGWSSR